MSAGRKSVSVKKDWNTPPKYVDLITKFFETIELDPCSNEFSSVQAKKKCILPDDGLSVNWNDFKTIYVNPPYGRCSDNKTSIYDWIKKGYDAYYYGCEILFLIPVATNTRHFKDFVFNGASVICFLNDTRLKFWSNGVEDKKGAPMACCLVYFGDNVDLFINVFRNSGKCVYLRNL